MPANDGSNPKWGSSTHNTGKDGSVTRCQEPVEMGMVLPGLSFHSQLCTYLWISFPLLQVLSSFIYIVGNTVIKALGLHTLQLPLPLIFFPYFQLEKIMQMDWLWSRALYHLWPEVGTRNTGATPSMTIWILMGGGWFLEHRCWVHNTRVLIVFMSSEKHNK